MPKGTSNKDGQIYTIQIISRTSLDKDSHKHIIRDNIIELKITKSNSIESYQRDIMIHLKQFENIKRTEKKKIVNNIIKQYRKIDEPAFQTGLNTKIISGPRDHNYYRWIIDLIKWMIETRQDLISRDL
jgi:hypothetical protein